jgi:DNA-binding MarR family transcriptional regulator
MTLIFRGMASKRKLPYQGYDLSLGQARVLFIISHGNGLSIKELSKQLRITSGAATQFVEGLVNLGLVTREADQKDRRIQRIRISEKAQKHHQQFYGEYIRQIEPLFKSLNVDELNQLISLLNKIEKPSFEDAKNKLKNNK